MDTPLTPLEARTLVSGIRADLSNGWDKLAKAYRGRIWEALDYPNWDAFVIGEFDGLMFKVPRLDRPELVQSLRGASMSNRAIAELLGVTEGTVRNDLQGAQNYATETVVGRDGKQYPTWANTATGNEPEVADPPWLPPATPPSPPRPPDQEDKFTFELGRAETATRSLNRAVGELSAISSTGLTLTPSQISRLRGIVKDLGGVAQGLKNLTDGN